MELDEGGGGEGGARDGVQGPVGFQVGEERGKGVYCAGWGADGVREGLQGEGAVGEGEAGEGGVLGVGGGGRAVAGGGRVCGVGGPF